MNGRDGGHDVLVVNCGSSTLRLKLLAADDCSTVAAVLVDRIGAGGGMLTTEVDGDRQSRPAAAASHAEAFAAAIDAVGAALAGNGREPAIAAVGHRVVHGGERFASSTAVDDGVLDSIAAVSDLAPLHNPANLAGIRAARERFPGLVHVAVFDTAFHQTMPAAAWRYAISDDFYRRHGIRRYGFHGSSHRYVSGRVLEIEPRLRRRRHSRVITCHLGNGCSIAAVRDGVSVDTSMGMTPLAGPPMGTRSGDLDPGVVLDMQIRLGLSAPEVRDLLNRESGLKALTGGISDMRDIEERASAGDDRCLLALELFHYRVRGYIGQYVAALGGCDALVFTAGIGENSARARSGICAGLHALGIRIDRRLNRALGLERRISPLQSWPAVWVIPTNEERIIAQETVLVAGVGQRRFR
jgi:acetate kinase